MAYRKTDKVVAALAAKRQAIVDAAIDLAGKGGIDAISYAAIADRAEIANGLINTYFADKAELLAAVVDEVLAGDRHAMAGAMAGQRYPANRLAMAIAALYGRWKKPLLMQALATVPAYQYALRGDLAAMITEACDVDDGAQARLMACAVLGAMQGMFECGSRVSDRPARVVEFALRGLGMPARAARGLAEAL